MSHDQYISNIIQPCHVFCGEWLLKILGAVDYLQCTQVNFGSSFVSRHHMACKEEPLALMAPATDPYLVGVAVDVRTAFEETQPGRVCMVVCVCLCVFAS